MKTHTATNCTIDNCPNTAWARQMCRKHYERWRVNGDPRIVKHSVPDRGTIQQWVLDHSSYREEECLIWPFTTNGAGYGLVNINGSRQLVTRYFCEKRNGPPPSSGHYAAHSCGNGHNKCVNPSHLEWKTPKENQADRLRHGTAHRGEKSSLAKLTETQIKQIKSATNVSQRELASQFGVSQGHISAIVTGKKWNHV